MNQHKLHIDNPLYQTPKNINRVGIVWLSILVGFGVLLLFSIVATQYFANGLHYQHALGKPAFFLLSIPIYQPFDWVVWAFKWNSLKSETVQDYLAGVYYIILLGSFVAVVSAAYIAYRYTRHQQNGSAHVHGSAHWAQLAEVKAMGLLDNPQGVYVGGYVNPKTKTLHYLRHDGPEHIILFAPTRSGKGVGNVLPTLLSWLDSVLVHDIKGENWALTAGWRRLAGNVVLKFEPTAADGSSVRFNPLEEIRLGTDKEVSDVQNIVTMIVDPDGKGINDHWAKTGHALLVGAFLHVLYAEADKTLAGIANFLSDPTRTLEDTLNYMLQSEHDPQGRREWRDTANQKTGIHPVVAASARDMLNKSENERSGVLSTALSFLTLYRDPIVARNTAYSEFKVSDLMNADKPVSLYLVVPPSDKDRLKPLIRLIINQVVRSLTESMDFKDGRSIAGYKHRLLLMIDEFPSLGRLDIFQESLAFIAGYGMKAYLIIQDISQLYAAYGREESILSNCHIRAAYAPNKLETAELLSKMSGVTTIVKNTYSYSGKRMNTILSNVSTSVQEVSRPLLTPDEVMRLPGATKDQKGNIKEAGDMLIFSAGFSPIYGKQILYFLDPVFSQRAKIAPPTESERLIHTPQINNSSSAQKSNHAQSSEMAVLNESTESMIHTINIQLQHTPSQIEKSPEINIKEAEKTENEVKIENDIEAKKEIEKKEDLESYALFDDLLLGQTGKEKSVNDEHFQREGR